MSLPQIAGNAPVATYTIITAANNTIQNNVAAGSERFGWSLVGTACDAVSAALIANNAAHSSLSGLQLKVRPACLHACMPDGRLAWLLCLIISLSYEVLPNTF